MKVKLESLFDVEDKVDLSGSGLSHTGVIVKVDFVESKHLFRYLVEFSDGSRTWLEEGSLSPHYDYKPPEGFYNDSEDLL